MKDRDLSIDVRANGSTMILGLRGDLDLASAGRLRDCLESIDDAYRRVVLDLTGLRFLDSTGVGVLAETNQRFGPEMRDLVLHNPQGHVAKVIEMTGLALVLSVISTGTAS